MSAAYALSGIWLFIATALPLELKTFGLILLLGEWLRNQKKEALLPCIFFLHIDGICRYQGAQYRVKRVHFFSRKFIFIDIEKQNHVLRLPLAFDAFPPDDFCHISRLCLGIKHAC